MVTHSIFIPVHFITNQTSSYTFPQILSSKSMEYFFLIKRGYVIILPLKCYGIFNFKKLLDFFNKQKKYQMLVTYSVLKSKF